LIKRQLNVSLPERPHPLPVDNDRSDQLGVLEHGHEQNGPNVTQLYAGHRIRIAIEIALLRREVGDMNGLFRLHHAAKVPTAAAQRRALTFLDQCWRHIVRGGKVEHLPIAQIHVSEGCLADMRGLRQYRLEHPCRVRRASSQ
jgi:hypothetical protein